MYEVGWCRMGTTSGTILFFKSVQTERGGTGRRFDRPCSDSDSDARIVGVRLQKE